MKTIYKYPLKHSGRQTVEMPLGACILSVQPQRDIPTIWALVETENPLMSRSFYVTGTGHEVPEFIDAAAFLGTVQLLGGTFVEHVFEV